MPQENNEAAELEHAEEIGFVIFPTADQSAEIVEPGKEALDFPASTVATQFSTVLGVLANAVVFVRRDEPDAVFLAEALIQRIAVVGAVADHSFWFGSRKTLRDVASMKSAEVRTYMAEKRQTGQRHWEGKYEEQQAVYANRRRVSGAYDKRLLRKRGERIERSFAHCYDTGGMRRTHLRGYENILKRLLIHVGAFNLSLIFRTLFGSGTPRELRNRPSRFIFVLSFLFRRFSAPVRGTLFYFSSSQLRQSWSHRSRGYNYAKQKSRVAPRAASITTLSY